MYNFLLLCTTDIVVTSNWDQVYTLEWHHNPCFQWLCSWWHHPLHPTTRRHSQKSCDNHSQVRQSVHCVLDSCTKWYMSLWVSPVTYPAGCRVSLEHPLHCHVLAEFGSSVMPTLRALNCFIQTLNIQVHEYECQTCFVLLFFLQFVGYSQKPPGWIHHRSLLLISAMAKT